MTKKRMLTLLQRFHTLFLWLPKFLGFFRLSERYYSDHLPILCYHGFGNIEDSQFRDIFMTESVFQKRLEWLRKNNYNVLSLESAIPLLRNAQLPPRSVVITIDDGFRSTGEIAIPLLQHYNFPATLYITTYYVKHANHPIFRLAVQYLFWKTTINCYPLDQFVSEGSCWMSTRGPEGEEAMWKIIEHGERSLDEQQRFQLFQKLASTLQVDIQDILDRKVLHLLTPEEIASIAAQGFDIQLHTHRHYLPDSLEEVRQELDENKRSLQPLTEKKLHHFCYPSGLWNDTQREFLGRVGMSTATTCDEHLNGPETDPLSLGRFCDNDLISMIEFEAEIRGFNQFVRLNPIKKRIRRILRL